MKDRLVFFVAGRAVWGFCDSDLEQVCIERGVARPKLKEKARVLPRELADKLGEVLGREFGVDAIEFREPW